MHARLNLRSRRQVPIWATVLLLGAGAWIIGLLAFVDAARQPPADLSIKADAVIVLTGGSERVATGLRLLAAGASDRLLITGVHEDTQLPDLIAMADVSDTHVPLEAIALGRQARDTKGNALEVAGWVEENPATTLRVVTANYHMPRALWELHVALPDATIIPHPVTPGQVRLDAWWRWPGTASLIVTEYTKYLVALARGVGKPA